MGHFQQVRWTTFGRSGGPLSNWPGGPLWMGFSTGDYVLTFDLANYTIEAKYTGN
ncbi:hypothetical protein [Prevotella sp. KH2C16]|uniref:hypothetical protein n=1 Tax=Prevotella sp. KH2C16 TaxID=1855325 RepID=UPI0015A6AAFC|nr:hypothetical protein [Prevotella sp. KH2C16]